MPLSSPILAPSASPFGGDEFHFTEANRTACGMLSDRHINLPSRTLPSNCPTFENIRNDERYAIQKLREVITHRAPEVGMGGESVGRDHGVLNWWWSDLPPYRARASVVSGKARSIAAMRG